MLLDLRGKTDFADYFIIASGTSERMLQALADAVLDTTRERLMVRGKQEGDAANGWVLVDFGNLILHLFAPEKRVYYSLEELWEEGKVLLHMQ